MMFQNPSTASFKLYNSLDQAGQSICVAVRDLLRKLRGTTFSPSFGCCTKAEPTA